MEHSGQKTNRSSIAAVTDLIMGEMVSIYNHRMARSHILATDDRAVLELSALFLFLDNHDPTNIILRYFAKIVFPGYRWHERWSTVTARRYSIVLAARF